MRYLGAAYYPESFPENDWQRDLDDMAEAHLNVVRLAESAWSVMEPERGRFHFEWLDRFIALAEERGIRVILGTPTYMPPAWLTDADPELNPLDRNGFRRGPGGRHHYCLSSPVYAEASDRIVEAMARHYGSHRNVIGWQLHNEIGQSSCYCRRCERQWREWLKAEYGTIEQLNKDWHHASWNRYYTRFDQIPIPAEYNEPPESRHSLASILAFKRFRSQQYIQYLIRQAELIGPYVADRWISHNAMGLDLHYDHAELFGALGTAGWDNYPWNRTDTALVHDLYRSFSKRAHWVLEQQCGSYGDGETVWRERLAPGEMTNITLQSFLHGAEGVLFWHWRSFRGGNWPYWQGVVGPKGQKTAIYKELKQLGAAIREWSSRLSEPVSVKPDTAFLMDYETMWAMERDRIHNDFNPMTVMRGFYKGIIHRGQSVDWVFPHSDFSAYRLLVIPHLLLADEALAEKLEDYVRDGGTLVLGPRTARYDRQGVLGEDFTPGPLTGLCGLETEEYAPLLAGRTVSVQWDDMTLKAEHWCEWIQSKSAEPEAVFTDGPFPDCCAVSRHRFGQGDVYYLGAYFQEEDYIPIMDTVLDRLGVPRDWVLPDGCEFLRQGSLTGLINLTDHTLEVPVPASLQNRVQEQTLLLQPFAFFVLPV